MPVDVETKAALVLAALTVRQLRVNNVLSDEDCRAIVRRLHQEEPVHANPDIDAAFDRIAAIISSP